MKQKTITQKLRENPWIIATFFLGLIFILMVGTDFFKEKQITIQEHFCSIIERTPSWGIMNGMNGTIFDVGYKDFNAMANMSYDVVNEILIPNYIFFIYHPGCGACAAQIEYFGDTWQDYVNSNLTVNCEEYWR